jgi:hypothetical protein
MAVSVMQFVLIVGLLAVIGFVAWLDHRLVGPPGYHDRKWSFTRCNVCPKESYGMPVCCGRWQRRPTEAERDLIARLCGLNPSEIY